MWNSQPDHRNTDKHKAAEKFNMIGQCDMEASNLTGPLVKGVCRYGHDTCMMARICVALTF